jgi:hypothetical protein
MDEWQRSSHSLEYPDPPVIVAPQLWHPPAWRPTKSCPRQSAVFGQPQIRDVKAWQLAGSAHSQEVSSLRASLRIFGSRLESRLRPTREGPSGSVRRNISSTC